MRDRILFFTIFALLVSLSVFFFLDEEPSGQRASSSGQDLEAGGGLRVVENNTLLGRLKRGFPVKCVVGDREMVFIAEEGRTRVKGLPPLAEKEEGGDLLFTDEWVYWWSEGTGLKLNLGAYYASSHYRENNWERLAEEIENSNIPYSCHGFEAADAWLSPPQDINFLDYSRTIKEETPEEKPLSEEGA